jgi:hypothetical protein
MELTTNAERRAWALLERMRETPMRRGALSVPGHHLKRDVARALLSEGVPPVLAQRIALQLAFKFHRHDLNDEPEWRAMGQILRREIAHLKDHVGLSNQRIITVLPKLSADQVSTLLDELMKADRTIAHTILHAAVNTSSPQAAGRRYLAEYRLVVRRLRAIDPTMARTLAAATFCAVAPLCKAMEHMTRFSSLMAQYGDQPKMARRLARAWFRTRPQAEDPTASNEEHHSG